MEQGDVRAPHRHVVCARQLHRSFRWLERNAIATLVGLAISAFLTAWIGGCGVARDACPKCGSGEPLSCIDSFYRAAQLLLLNSWDDPHGSVAIDIARVLAVLAAFFGIAEFARRLFDTALQRWIVRFAYRDHVVVCGLDNAGFALCERLVDDGESVIAIDKHADNPLVTRARRSGVLVHIGDPIDPEELDAMHIGAASWIVAPHGDPRVAAVARQMIDVDANRTLRCLLAQPRETIEARPMLLSQRRLSDAQLGFTVIQANIADRAASFLASDASLFGHVLRHRTLEELRGSARVPRRVLVLGDTEFCVRLAATLAWDAAIVYSPVAERDMLDLMLVHPDADAVIAALRAALGARTRAGELGVGLHGRPYRQPLDDVLCDGDVFARERHADEAADYDLVVVSCATSERTFANAEAVARRYSSVARRELASKPQHAQRFAPDPIVVAALDGDMREVIAHDRLCFEPGALRTAYDPTEGAGDRRQLLYAYDLWRASLSAERLLGSLHKDADALDSASIERLAQRAHGAYLNAKLAKQRRPLLDWPAIREAWEKIEVEDLRESNRQFVRDIDRKLAMIGCRRRCACERPAPATELTEVELECLARTEHERWLVERWERGWAQDMTRDQARGISTSLKPWHELDADTQQIDREMIRRMQGEMLRPEGFDIERW